ncbi:MAG TPA: HEAT repeat domain-containing protein [Elusimicrobiota bacterium]|nr:HEAT repeat domain-containing protein [Elusimicrobiota bacterium]
MNRLLRLTTLVFAAMFSASGAHAEWARSMIAEFPQGAQRAKLLRLNDGPALAVFETPKTLTVLRWRNGDWTRVSVPIPYDGPTDVEACACRGDSIVRLYVAYQGDPRVTELTPGTDGWEVEDFAPDGEREGSHPMSAYTDGIAWTISRVDHRPSLFIRRRLVQKILECRYWSSGWRCAPSVETAAFGSWGDLKTAPRGWSDKDILIDGTALQVRETSGWKKTVDFHGISAIPSISVPRRLYVFATKNQMIDLDAGLLPARSVPMLENEWAPDNPRASGRESVPADFVSQQVAISRTYDAIGSPRGKGVETLFGKLEDRQIHELRWTNAGWKDEAVAAFAGGSQEAIVGDARGDGHDRVYALADDTPDSSPRTALWELSYYPRRIVVLVPDPASESVEPASRRLLGEMIRAEMGRHGHLAVVDARSQDAANDERSLMKQTAGGGAVPDAAVKYRIEEKSGLYEISAVLSTKRGTAAREFLERPVAKAELSQVALALARRVAEEWPQDFVGDARTPRAAPTAERASSPPASAASAGTCDVLQVRFNAVSSDPNVARAIDVALNSRSRPQRTAASVASMDALGIPKNLDGLAQARALIAAPMPWCRYWGYQIVSYLELAGVRDAESKHDLARGLHDPDASSRRGAVLALGAYTDEDLLPPLYRVFSTDPDPPVRESVAISLSSSGLYTAAQRQRMLPIFLRVLKDERQDQQTRGWAAHALSDMTGQDFGLDTARWQNWIAAHR